MKQREILRRVRKRMKAEGLTQRTLAAQLGISQGHLSKVLRGRPQRPTRLLRILEIWATDSSPQKTLQGDTDEQALLMAARRAARGSAHTMRLLTELMLLLDRLRGPSRRQP